MTAITLDGILRGKAWDWYPFLPSVASLVLSLLITPKAERIFGDQVSTFLDARGFTGPQKAVIEGIARDRGLQLATVSTFLSTFFLCVSLAGQIARVALDIVILLVFVVGLYGTLRICFRAPGFHSTTYVSWNALRRWQITYIDFYNAILVAVNGLTVVAAALTLPRA